MRRRSSVGKSAELVIVSLLVRCTNWALMSELGITSLCPWKRHLMLISYQALCVVRQHRCLFDNGIYWRKTLKNAKKEQADMVLPISPKVALGNKRPMPNVYDVVPQVRRINRTN